MRVLMVGPSPEIPGGVSQVIRTILDNAPQCLEFEMLPTLKPFGSISYLHHRKGVYFVNAWRGIYHLLKTLVSASQRIKKAQADLAHVHLASRGSTLRKYLITRFLLKRQIPYVIHSHGASFREFYENLPYSLKIRIRDMFDQGCGIIVLSKEWENFYDYIMEDRKVRIWIMPNPIVLPTVWLQESDASLRLLYLGIMDERKGARRVLQAISSLPHPLQQRVYLKMAGNGDLDAMRHFADKLGLTPQVDIRAWIEGQEKECWLRETNAFILPSRAEGLPMAMLEAMAYGKALIVSPVGGIPEFVSDGQEGFLVPSDDIEAISRAIATLAENPELRAQMGRAARARVEELDISRYMQKLISIYEHCLEKQQEVL